MKKTFSVAVEHNGHQVVGQKAIGAFFHAIFIWKSREANLINFQRYFGEVDGVTQYRNLIVNHANDPISFYAALDEDGKAFFLRMVDSTIPLALN